MQKSEFKLERDGQRLHNYLWTPDNVDNSRGIVLIIHGSAEHGKRYENFAGFLSSNGYIVCAGDYRGHGLSAPGKDDLGFLSVSNGWVKVVEDIYALMLLLKTKYPGLKMFVLGHSMGSFLARSYAIRYGDEINGLILSGTAHNPKWLLLFGRYLAQKDIKAGKERFRNPLINKLAFRGLNNSFKDGKTGFEWLSHDTKIVELYVKDDLCGYDFTSSAFRDMFGGLLEITDMKNIAKMPKNLPVLIISGSDDPVGGMGKMVRKCYTAFTSAGMINVKMKLYEGMRHEILNEIGKETVYQDILDWLA